MTNKKTKYRSITQHIKRAPTKERIDEIAEKWIDKWESEQTWLIKRLGNAVAKDEFDEMCKCIGSLRKMSEKRFAGLRNSAKEIIGKINDKADKSDT